ncbi:MotA/TolQ/ExbB proton channel family protein [Luteolibacter sp. AS25]|uniref:MotA/TolQ/ExbB proton channel family protein n=1 Tax=Luteolibacter sp. AS25 TaxID=3135776 RepID=UPI00398B2970
MIQAIQQIIHEGGPTLIALLLLAVAIYSTLFSTWRNLLATRKTVDESHRPKSSGVGSSMPWERRELSSREIIRGHASLELDQIAWVERRLPFLTILISVAPLLGLLGTVAGMLITFSGMAAGSEAPLDTISTGISRALVTTQAGLIIAIPAAFLLALIKRQAETTHLTLQKHLHSALAGNSSPTSLP